MQGLVSEGTYIVTATRGVASPVDARASVRGYIYRDSTKGGGHLSMRLCFNVLSQRRVGLMVALHRHGRALVFA